MWAGAIHRLRWRPNGCNSSPDGDAGRRRRIRRLAAFTGVLVIAGALGGLPVYVHPQVDALRRADAIVILGGPSYSNIPFGLDLAAKGWAPTVVVSNPNGSNDQWLTDYCASHPPGIAIQCFIPDPPTTRGEGLELHRLAVQYHWHTVIVVTWLPHVSRARFVLQHCFDGDLIVVASPTHLSPLGWAYQYAYQTVGYARALFQLAC